MLLKDFVIDILKKENVNSILKACKSLSEKGFYYERLWDLVIKFNCCDVFENYINLIGNANKGKLKKLESVQNYLLKNNIISGSSSGCSDITLLNKKTNTYIFASCKYFSDDENKSVEDYDIQKIIAMIEDNKEVYEKYEIYLLVKDKSKVYKKFSNSSDTSKYITKYIKIENILDINDLNKYFEIFKYKLSNVKFEDYDEIFCSKKEKLKLRFHQNLIVSRTSKLIEEGNKQFLWGCKCRSGKTYMVGGLILEQRNIKDNINVLVITPAPTETCPQFTDELFNKFLDFKDFNIVYLESSKNIIKLSTRNILITSKQLLQQYINDNTIMKIKDLKLDMIFFDENHFTGTTKLSKDIINSYSHKNTIKIFLTATYQKPVKEWNISDECKLYWDIEDEQLCKSRDIVKLKEKHNINNILVNDLVTYDNYPDLHILTTMFDSRRYEIIKDKIMDSNYGFSFDVLFSLKNKKFEYPEEIKKVLRYISGSEKETDYKITDKSIFNRIRNICTEKKSRIPFTQLWFLPVVNINRISENLKELIQKDLILKNYNVMIVNSNVDKLAKDIKDEINKQEIISKKQNKDGLIILAGNMLSLGITLQNCDVVFLMNNTLSSDKVLQQMYRCMSESYKGDKKIGFVVDMNISRVLNTCVTYNVHDNKLNTEDKIKYLINNHLINIDVDYFDLKENNSNKIINKLLDIWKSDPINNLRTLLRQIENEIIELNTSDQQELNKYFTKSLQNEKLTIEINDEKQELPSGKEIVHEEIKDKVKQDKIEKEIEISLSKDVLPFIVPLSCILTISDERKDFIEMLNIIKYNKELLEIFNEQSYIWWNKKDIIDLIKKIVEKYIDKNSLTYDIAIQFKLQLQSLIDRPKELLELINDCLKPKQLEKQKFGEVFTPTSLINEMLDQLPKDIFENENLKWFDPANGMGNFPTMVYLRLMNGLKDKIKDSKKRKKHILENMLYMSELNKKNCFVCKQILDIKNEYKLNIYNGDSLTLDIKDKFNIDKFDIIMGNPPYNKGGIKSSTGKMLGEKNITIWNNFVELSFTMLKEDGYLIFINPLSWLKKSHSLHNTLLEKHVLWMKLWDNSKSKSVINADIPLSLYVLQNKQNSNKEKTCVISELSRRNLKSESNVYLNKKYSVPLAFHSIFNKIIKKIEKNPELKLDVLTKTVKSDDKKSYKLPEKYEVDDMLGIDTFRIKDGYFVKKMKNKHVDTEKQKLIIANKCSLKGSLIDNGKIGLIGNHKFYIVGEKLDKLKLLFETKLCEIIANFTKYSQDFIEKDLFTYMIDIRKNKEIKEINDEELCKYFNFTKEEIKLIEKVK